MIKSEKSSSDSSVRKFAKSTSRELRIVKTRIHEIKDQKSLINVPYRKMISPIMTKSISQAILRKLEEEKIYKNPGYTAKQMATDLHTNTRYLSAVVNSRFKKSYSSLLNEYRIKDAVVLLADKRLRNKNIEEIGLMVGFANRQSFYAAFSKYVGETPRSFRQKYI